MAAATSTARKRIYERRLARRSDELDLSAAPPEVADEIADEARVLEELADQAETDRILSRKRALADHHMKSRKRGR